MRKITVSHGLVLNTLSNQSPRARPMKVAMTMVSPRVLASPTSLRAFLVSSFMKATSLLLARPLPTNKDCHNAELEFV